MAFGIILTLTAHGVVRADALVSAADAPCSEAGLGMAPALQICDSGGMGARSCDTKWTVSVSGWGWPSGCGVTCDNGHYACCSNPTWYRNAVCSCVPEPQEPVPWTPETPGL